MPLSGLRFPDAVLAWNLISLVAFLASLKIIAASIPEPGSMFLPIAALLPFSLPVYANFQQAQLTMVLCS